MARRTRYLLHTCIQVSGESFRALKRWPACCGRRRLSPLTVHIDRFHFFNVFRHVVGFEALIHADTRKYVHHFVLYDGEGGGSGSGEEGGSGQADRSVSS